MQFSPVYDIVCRGLRDFHTMTLRSSASRASTFLFILKSSFLPQSRIADQRQAHFLETNSQHNQTFSKQHKETLLSIDTMREIVHMQVGQCGNQTGAKFWQVRAIPKVRCVKVPSITAISHFETPLQSLVSPDDVR